MSIAEIGELIHQAGFGLISWDAVNAAIISAFPGSFSAIASHGRRDGKANFVSIAGMPEKSMEDYFAYYSTVNPWNPYWAQMKSGEIMRSEIDCPASLFVKTEFINDWLMPIQRNSIGMGLKLDATANDDLFLSIHFHGNLGDTFTPQIDALLRGQSGNLGRAVEMNRFLSDHIGKSVAAAALVERGSSIGFVVDCDLKIVEANVSATTAFSAGRPVKAIGNVACFNEDVLHKWFAQNVRGLIAGMPIGSTTYILPRHDHVWQVKLARIREHDPRSGNRYFPSRHLVLVLVKDIRGSSQTVDLMALKSFALTPSEIRMCQALVQGFTISEAADRLGITLETARHRLKTIFQKTGTNRQAALMSLLLKSI
jgi:DNA-binding CsgD family transcriptional regulator